MTAILPRCETCLNCLEFHTDWIGQVIWKHPQLRCIASPPVVYEAEDDKELLLMERICQECKKPFSPKRQHGGQILCGPDCREARRDRKHRESELRCKKRWISGRAA